MVRNVLSRILVPAFFSVTLSALASADSTGVAGMHSWRKEGGRTCFAEHFHNGESSGMRTRKQAEIVAIRSWVSYTDFEYGSDWSRWGKSASKRMSCTLSSRGWGCSLESRPCK